MRILYRRRTLFSISFFLLCLQPIVPVAAQTLARPGWVGSGLTQETWWQNAVFYRIQPKNFQDSDGDGVGDLHGILQRLDYLQSLGVDAIVLEPPFDDTGFDDLLSEATRRHVRLIVELSPGTTQRTLAEARSWLTRGAAGIYAKSSLAANQPGTVSDLMQALRTLTNSFPGERLLLTDNDPTAASARRGQRNELVDFTFGNGSTALETYRSEMETAQSSSNIPFLLQLDDKTPSDTALAKILATMLLGSRGAVSLGYGQEIGIARSPADSPTMQWTPGNITPPKPSEPAPVAETPKPTPTPQRSDVYGSFVPYVPPPRKPAPVPIDKNTGKPYVDPNSLMGFTTGALPAVTPAPDHALANVAVEDVNPDSLLNYYRRLSQLHHGNPALRAGSTTVLDHNADNALVWVRQASPGTSSGTVIIACNLSSQSRTLSLKGDLEHLHLRAGGLRMLLFSDKANLRFQTTDQLVLAPWSVFIGELHPYY
jgi:glycosidase